MNIPSYHLTNKVKPVCNDHLYKNIISRDLFSNVF